MGGEGTEVLGEGRGEGGGCALSVGTRWEGNGVGMEVSRVIVLLTKK